ncbi:amidohydrolase family protein [Actinocorallia sp. API 0066]|uniref:amidohydrolase family protein n=1 Tax=Actinocorallia sp. API 0066 TaxID=2896846 RepID=UPI001E48DE7B|nr:amidohydrolase family protein [Actinocorallia sp. API 0066]MCD0449440.1 amidohydrolase family protein [Actinocorallia sp. API 0066]
MSNRIDVHQHMVPPAYAAWLRGHGVHTPGGRALPDWSPQTAIGFMDQNGIATGILSLTAPGVHLGDAAEARLAAREANDYGAQLVADHPDRFGFWAALPLPDVTGAVAEAVRALDTLPAEGVVLLANSRGLYLGDTVLDPLMAELNERSATVFVHPAELPGNPPVEGIPAFAADFLLDTTRAAFNLVKHDVPRRFPNLRFILSHAGGFVPYASHRLAATVFAETGRDPFAILDDLAGFYFDTALSSSPAALPTLHAFAKPGHILYGSDWPFAPDLAVAYFNEAIADDGAIGRTNALPLLRRAGAATA